MSKSLIYTPFYLYLSAILFLTYQIPYEFKMDVARMRIFSSLAKRHPKINTVVTSIFILQYILLFASLAFLVTLITSVITKSL